MKRTRKLFSDINKNAKPVAKRDKIIIDEQELASIVTRRIYAESKYFKKGELISLAESTNLDSNDTTHFTNITNLYDSIKRLRSLYKIPKGTNEWDELNIQDFKTLVDQFLDDIFKSRSEYKDFFITQETTLLDLRKNNSYLLFRPVGFTMITRLYIEFYKMNEIDFFKKNIDKISYHFPESPFNKIIWNRGKMDTKSKTQTLMVELTLYILGKYTKDIDELKRSLQEVTKDDNIELPTILI